MINKMKNENSKTLSASLGENQNEIIVKAESFNPNDPLFLENDWKNWDIDFMVIMDAIAHLGMKVQSLAALEDTERWLKMAPKSVQVAFLALMAENRRLYEIHDQMAKIYRERLTAWKKFNNEITNGKQDDTQTEK